MVKFYYNVIVGLIATVIVKAEAQHESDFGFVVLISILAPILAVALATGGGLAVYRALAHGALQIIATTWNVAREAASFGLRLK